MEKNFFETEVEKALEVLRNGGVILYPTDTIWGIGCDATNKQAVKRIYDIKNREDSKSMIILVADERDPVGDPGGLGGFEEEEIGGGRIDVDGAAAAGVGDGGGLVVRLQPHGGSRRQRDGRAIDRPAGFGLDDAHVHA